MTFHLVTVIALAGLTAQLCAAQYSTLYSFKGGSDGASPYGGLTLGKSGVLYGTTFGGGDYAGDGTVFSFALEEDSWIHTVLLTFNRTGGSMPAANLVLGGDQFLYGTTVGGGSGAGTIFELVPSKAGEWEEALLYTFDSDHGSDNHTPWGAVLIGPDGSLYTTARGGTAVALTPPVTPDGPYTGSVIYTFAGYGGQSTGPLAGFVSEGGALYGTTFSCTPDGCGAAYELTPPAVAGGTWIETTLHNFGAVEGDGAGPAASLTVGQGGVLYGTTFYGGPGRSCAYPKQNGCGTVFQLTPPAGAGGAWTETVLYSFTGLAGDGAFPGGPVVVGENGVLYGTTEYGGGGGSCSYYEAYGCGTVYQLTPPALPDGSWTETVLHTFTGQNGDGAVPIAGVRFRRSALRRHFSRWFCGSGRHFRDLAVVVAFATAYRATAADIATVRGCSPALASTA